MAVRVWSRSFCYRFHFAVGAKHRVGVVLHLVGNLANHGQYPSLKNQEVAEGSSGNLTWYSRKGRQPKVGALVLSNERSPDRGLDDNWCRAWSAKMDLPVD